MTLEEALAEIDRLKERTFEAFYWGYIGGYARASLNHGDTGEEEMTPECAMAVHEDMEQSYREFWAGKTREDKTIETYRAALAWLKEHRE